MAKGTKNKVILIGNLGADPEIRYMQSGVAVANLSVATVEAWTDKQTNEKREETEWHRVVIYGRLAEIAGEYGRKGGKVYVEGRLRTRKWTDQQGVERYTTEIVADEMQLIGGNPQNGGQQGGGGQQGTYQQGQNNRPQGQRPQGQTNRPQGQRPQGQTNRPQNAPPAPQGGFAPPVEPDYSAGGGFNPNDPRGPMEPPIDYDDDIPF